MVMGPKAWNCVMRGPPPTDAHKAKRFSHISYPWLAEGALRMAHVLRDYPLYQALPWDDATNYVVVRRVDEDDTDKMVDEVHEWLDSSVKDYH
jgi:hypothetical protein